MSIQNHSLHVEHCVSAQKPENRERLNMYVQRREIYLRHLGEGCKVSFPIKIVRIH